MRSKLIIGSSIVFMFLLSVIPFPTSASTTATPTTPVAGDTFIYKVTSWNVPSNLSVFLSGVTGLSTNINFVGSVLAVKIISIGPVGYTYGMYVKAGSGPLSVTISHNNISQAISSFYAPILTNTGDLTLSVPANTAFPLISSATALFNKSSCGGCIPNLFWFKVSNWTTYEHSLTLHGFNITESTGLVTIAQIGPTYSDHSQANTSLTFTKTSDTVLTKLSVHAKIMNNSTHSLTPVSFEIGYDSTNYHPLPSTLKSGDDLKYTYDTANLNITTHLDNTTTTDINAYISANSADFSGKTTLSSYLTYIENQTNSLQGKVASEFQIITINGTSYSAIVANYGSSSYIELINGFTGNYDPSSPTTAYSTRVPAITPDFDLWDGQMTGANAIGNIFVKLFSRNTASSSLKTNYTNLGLISGPNLGFTAQSSQQNNYHLNQAAAHIDFTFNSTTLNRTALNISSSIVIPSVKLSFSADLAEGRAVSNDGYILSQGYKITATATVTSPLLTSPATFNVNFEVKIKLSSGAPSSILSLASTANQNVDSIKAGAPSSPGFELIPVFVGLVVLPVLVKKIKIRSK